MQGRIVWYTTSYVGQEKGDSALLLVLVHQLVHQLVRKILMNVIMLMNQILDVKESHAATLLEERGK
jgi:hypothetical protein